MMGRGGRKRILFGYQCDSNWQLDIQPGGNEKDQEEILEFSIANGRIEGESP